MQNLLFLIGTGLGIYFLSKKNVPGATITPTPPTTPTTPTTPEQPIQIIPAIPQGRWIKPVCRIVRDRNLGTPVGTALIEARKKRLFS